MSEAVAYYRTSSQTNVDGDSVERQRAAVQSYARSNGITVVSEYYDAAVSGADPVLGRDGFAAMIDHIAGNGVRAILVESPDRFARDLIVAETGYAWLAEQGIDLIPTTAPTYFTDGTPTSKLIRQILGAVAEFDKTQTVAKLKAARDRIKAATGKCEGRKSHAELRPGMVKEAKRLHRRNPRTGKRRSLRRIAGELASLGYLNERGMIYGPQSIKAMVAG